jgi:hypothetical protein
MINDGRGSRVVSEMINERRGIMALGFTAVQGLGFRLPRRCEMIDEENCVAIGWATNQL